MGLHLVRFRYLDVVVQSQVQRHRGGEGAAVVSGIK